MILNQRNSNVLPETIRLLFYIKTTSDDNNSLQRECQRMIDVIYKEFPGALPQPSGKNNLFS